MMWQDFVFMVGSALSIVFLAPTLRDVSARVPLGTSVPSMLIGSVYAFTFFTMEMTFSAAGASVTALMWSLIATYRSPDSPFSALDGYAGTVSRYGRDVWFGMKQYELGYRYVR